MRWACAHWSLALLAAAWVQPSDAQVTPARATSSTPIAMTATTPRPMTPPAVASSSTPITPTTPSYLPQITATTTPVVPVSLSVTASSTPIPASPAATAVLASASQTTTAPPSLPSPASASPSSAQAPTPTQLSTPSAPATQGSAPVFSAPSFTPVAATEDAPAFEPGQLLVLWTSDEATNSGLATLLSRYQQRPRVRYTLGNLGFTVVMLALPTDREALALLAQLRAEQPDWVVDRNARSAPLQSTPASNSPTSASQEAAPRLYAQKMLGDAGNVSALAIPSLRLGVIDSAVDSALAQAAALNGSSITQRSVLGPTDKPAPATHGNAVLQLLVGKAQTNGFAGSAPAVLLYWASVMRETAGKPSTNTLSLVLALDWLLSQQVALVNMSLGGQGDAVLKAAINRLQSKNIAIIAAAGNNPSANAPPVYPAAYPGVWAITAVDAAGKLYAQAQRASYISLAAPGVELWVPSSAADNTGSYVSGTSYATALATAALAWQPVSYWTQTPAQQRTHICAKARKLAEEAFAGCGLVQKATAP